MINNKLTPKIKSEILDYLESIKHDFDKQEIKNCIDILNEKEGKSFTEWDNSILLRLIDDSELIKLINQITIKNEHKNAFD